MRAFKKEILRLYAVTDREWLHGETLCSAVEKAVRGGASVVQLREKNMAYDDFLNEAREISALCNKYAVPLIINDNVDIALACGASGVHVGQSDRCCAEVRKIIGEDKILGVSAQTVEQAIKAEREGADYLGVGAIFSTSTKNDADAVSIETLKNICRAVKIPVVAIGGINENNIALLNGSGICGAALVSAIFAGSDIEASCRRLLELCKKL